ncbi:hypothetical protein I5H21_gp068 [Mycobacterium phage Byougenkin]|uniref:Uncharacterized protein n=1 Tax=Mycobacterium phage Byougenkin TaxID=2182394 RepID=A0A2U8UNC2_9CAUD|nr:hypothetical protein I5H21_gp068 [Mycobacterium phage Byougenkin]AWN04991.1 hypothetical protein SEA_BYOUGENKIN_68 [Mycobacterium phage Byougenkin]
MDAAELAAWRRKRRYRRSAWGHPRPPAPTETTTHTGEPMSNLTPEQLEAIAYIVLAFTGPPSLAYFLVKGLFR